MPAKVHARTLGGTSNEHEEEPPEKCKDASVNLNHDLC